MVVCTSTMASKVSPWQATGFSQADRPRPTCDSHVFSPYPKIGNSAITPLQQTSQNSSRPPSSDSRQHQRQRRSRSKHRRGGQPGHPGHTRTLLAVDAVDEIVVLKPEQCPGCSARLSGEDPTPWRHQVIEIPPIQPVVTEYQWHQLMCLTCGTVTRAPWPPGVPSGTYGPRVHATVALCTGVYRLSKRMTQQMMSEVFGVPMSVGTLSPLEQTMTAAVTAPVEEARTYVHEQAVAHLDETSWRQGGKHAWLWVAVTSWVTVFAQFIGLCSGVRPCSRRSISLVVSAPLPRPLAVLRQAAPRACPPAVP